MSPRATATLEPDLEAGLKRLKLAAVRRMAPEVLKTAKVQRWAPEELLRTFVEAEIAARDASNERARRKAAGFPVSRTLEAFDLSESSVPRVAFEHLASLDWIEGAENVVLVGPAGTGKSHCETEDPARSRATAQTGTGSGGYDPKVSLALSGSPAGMTPTSHGPPSPGRALSARYVCPLAVGAGPGRRGVGLIRSPSTPSGV